MPDTVELGDVGRVDLGQRRIALVCERAAVRDPVLGRQRGELVGRERGCGRDPAASVVPRHEVGDSERERDDDRDDRHEERDRHAGQDRGRRAAPAAGRGVAKLLDLALDRVNRMAQPALVCLALARASESRFLLAAPRTASLCSRICRAASAARSPAFSIEVAASVTCFAKSSSTSVSWSSSDSASPSASASGGPEPRSAPASDSARSGGKPSSSRRCSSCSRSASSGCLATVAGLTSARLRVFTASGQPEFPTTGIRDHLLAGIDGSSRALSRGRCSPTRARTYAQRPRSPRRRTSERRGRRRPPKARRRDGAIPPPRSRARAPRSRSTAASRPLPPGRRSRHGRALPGSEHAEEDHDQSVACLRRQHPTPLPLRRKTRPQASFKTPRRSSAARVRRIARAEREAPRRSASLRRADS